VNFKLNKIALALPISLMTLGAIAAVSPDDIPTVELTQVQKNLNTKVNNKQGTGRYFILLEDEPVALYQGNVKGFKATNVTASGGINANKKGKLNLQSSASVMYSDYLAVKQNQTLTNIKSALKRDISVQNRFKVALNALVVSIEPNEAMALRKMPGVLAVEKEEMHHILTDVGPQHVGAPEIWENTDIEGPKGEGLVVGVLDTGIASYTDKVWTYQGADGFIGKEFHPSFADVGADGYDHTNPNGEGVYFGECIDSPHWCNDKVIGVLSFEGLKTSGLYDMRADTGQDDHGHGTHVASTIAGNHVNDVNYPTVYPSMESQWDHKYYDSELAVSISGVAPHANIVSYKTCAVNGCSPSAAVEALEHAIANNVDVINYSVGGSAGSPWFDADALAFLAAREAGLFVAVAAGNAGTEGEKTIGSPGNSPWVTTVAALSHSRDFTEEKTASFAGGTAPLENLTGKGATSGISTLTDIVYAGDIENATEAEVAGMVGACGDYSLPSKWDAESIEGKVVICRRGGIDADGAPLSRLSKGDVAQYAGAAGMIFINSEDEYDNVANDLHMLPTVHLNKVDGEKLLAWLAEGEGHQVSFTDSELVLNDNKADITAVFTSRGPDYFSNDYLVPDVGAPGVDILAGGLGDGMQSPQSQVYEMVDGKFRFMSGTSMASPHIAGMYVLMKAAHPEWTAAEAQSALMMTAYTAVKEDDDFDGELNRADIHRTGSGSARVNLAINAGLVMNETRQGYLAANPHAEELGLTDDIEGWHGQPHQMNMPSLSKGECLLECDWTRTFKATKAGSWTVSFEYHNEGFSLSADTSEFTASEGEEVVINFTAEAQEGLADKWVNGRVVLTPTDSSMPVQTLPVAVNLIAGKAPKSVNIDVKRTNDSVPVVGITTIGTDDLTVTKSEIAKADIHEFDLMRDATNGTIWHWDDPDSLTIHSIPLNIQADSKRLVVEVLETSSPDIDVYIGIDSDLDGKPSVQEMSLMEHMSATETSFELIDEVNPRPDTYFVLIHNWAEGPAPLTNEQMVCESGQEPDEGMTCADAPVMDNVKLAITNVTYDKDNMVVKAPSSVEPLAAVDTRIKWKQSMAEGDIYHGVFWLGTSAELDKNIGTVRVNMLRGSDDVKVTEPKVNGDKMYFDISTASNNSPEVRDYDFKVELADGVAVDLLMVDSVIDGVNMSFNANDADYVINGNTLSWNHSQALGASSVTFTLVLDTADVTGLIDATPVIETSVSTSDEAEVTTPMPVFIAGNPTFEAMAAESKVTEGSQVTLIATVIDAVIENPTLSYQWIQVSGPSVTFSGSGDVITFTAPMLPADDVIAFEFIGSNGSKSSEPISVSVEVIKQVETPVTPPVEEPVTPPAEDPETPPLEEPVSPPKEEPVTPPAVTPVTPPVEEPVVDENDSSGGSTNLAFFLLTACGLLARKRKS